MSFVMVSPGRIFTFFSPTVVRWFRGSREKLGFSPRGEHYFASWGCFSMRKINDEKANRKILVIMEWFC